MAGPRTSPPPLRPFGELRRHFLIVATAVVAIVALGTASFLTIRPTRAVSGAAAAPVRLLDDPRTADPCGLLEVPALRRFGAPALLPSYGPVAGCTARISTIGDGSVLVATVWQAPSTVPPSGVASRRGPVVVYAGEQADRDCQRTIVLPDRSRVFVDVTAYFDRTSPVCAIADAAVGPAVAALTGHTVPTRTIDPPPNSVLTVPACALLDAAALAEVGNVPPRSEPGYNDWSCTWGLDPTTPNAAQVSVNYRYQSDLKVGTPGAPIAGRATTVVSGGQEPACELWLAQRDFTVPGSGRRVELVSIHVGLGAEGTAAQACQKARDLGAVVARKLPPTR